ncbi:MAG: hypothetical protein ACR2NU_09760 [Aeoliella sp.]
MSSLQSSTGNSASADNTATIEAPEAAKYDGPLCEKCEAPLSADQMVCRSCGYYASMGMFVELDSEWEAVADPNAEAKPSKSVMEELTGAIPGWLWVLIGTNFAIIVACVVGRGILGAEATAESWWGVTQYFVSLFVIILLHIICFVITASENPEIGVTDMVVSPLKGWIRSYQMLPERLWLINAKTNCVTAGICAILIVGGIPWERVWDWNIKQPTKSSLIDAVKSAGNGPANEEGLEEAVADFAGDAGNMNDSKPTPKKTEKPKPRKTTDCLIVGYNLDDREQIKYLLIATESNGRLVFAGQIVPEIPAEEKRALRNRLMQSHTGRPFVKTGREAAWVHPRFPCRISYTEQAENGKLLEMEWEETLDELKLPWEN